LVGALLRVGRRRPGLRVGVEELLKFLGAELNFEGVYLLGVVLVMSHHFFDLVEVVLQVGQHLGIAQLDQEVFVSQYQASVLGRLLVAEVVGRLGFVSCFELVQKLVLLFLVL